jgi:hypothetical protein
MTEENVPGSEYVNVSANNISSCCTSSRGTIFTWGADLEQCKISDIPSRNSETNNFQNRRADFETKVNLSKQDSIEAMPPHTKSAILTSPEQENSSNGPEERNDENRGPQSSAGCVPIINVQWRKIRKWSEMWELCPSMLNYCPRRYN